MRIVVQAEGAPPNIGGIATQRESGVSWHKFLTESSAV